jgi:hypothetical protein
MFSDATSLPSLSDQVFLEIPPPVEQWLPQSSSGYHWRTFLNQCCLQAFLPWFQAEFAANASVSPNSAALPSFWEVVNGTAITFDNARLVFIPTVAIDLEELRVPQEWIDIPNWAADYYVSMQVNPDEGWIRVVGYTTHQQLKTVENYDPGDRSYSLATEDLVRDINALWITRQLYPQALLRTAIAPLPTLPQAQAENLLERLGNPTLQFPRLAVPFTLWGALLSHGGWRQCLYERRQDLPEQWSVQRWLQTGISGFAQQFGWRSLEFRPVQIGVRNTNRGVARQLVIAGDRYEFSVTPIEDFKGRSWRFELRRLAGDQIPASFRLRLLTEDLQPFECNEDVATQPRDRLRVEVIVDPGEALVWEIEPMPEACDREILRF